LSYIKKLC
jgi:SNF2 family DNA or RNA helicase